MNNDIQQIAEAYLERGQMRPSRRELADSPSGPAPFEPATRGPIPENFNDAAQQIANFYHEPLTPKLRNMLYAAWNASIFFSED